MELEIKKQAFTLLELENGIKNIREKSGKTKFNEKNNLRQNPIFTSICNLEDQSKSRLKYSFFRMEKFETKARKYLDDINTVVFSENKII